MHAAVATAPKHALSGKRREKQDHRHGAINAAYFCPWSRPAKRWKPSNLPDHSSFAYSDLINVKEPLQRIANVGPQLELETRMFRLASILYTIVTITLSGNFILICLAMGFDTLDRLVLVAAIGAVVAIPTTALLTYRL